MTPTTPAGAQPPPTVYAWAGGAEAFSRLTRIFYGHVRTTRSWRRCSPR